jgi:hypothetical protein
VFVVGSDGLCPARCPSDISEPRHGTNISDYVCGAGTNMLFELLLLEWFPTICVKSLKQLIIKNVIN